MSHVRMSMVTTTVTLIKTSLIVFVFSLFPFYLCDVFVMRYLYTKCLLG